MNALMAEFADCNADGNALESVKAQALVKKWQKYITDNYYPVQRKFLQDLVQCIPQMNASKLTLTGTAKELPSL